MGLSASARSMKCQLKKKGLTESQAMTYLIEHGFIQPDIKYHNSRALKETQAPPLGGGHLTADLSSDHKNPSAGNDRPPAPVVSLGTRIDEQFIENYLINLANGVEGFTAPIAQQLQTFWDKKKGFKPIEADVESEGVAASKYRDVRSNYFEVLHDSAPCDPAAPD